MKFICKNIEEEQLLPNLNTKKKKKGILISLREAVKAKQLLFHIK